MFYSMSKMCVLCWEGPDFLATPLFTKTIPLGLLITVQAKQQQQQQHQDMVYL